MKKTVISRNAILGVILGDGHVSKDGSVSVLHTTKNLDYLEWKLKYLRDSGVKCCEIRHIDNNGFPGACFRVSSTRWGKFLRKFLYSSGGKNFYKRKLLNRLDPVHIAIWYMDDGSLSQKKRNGIVHANDLTISTYTTKENNQIIIDYFYEVYGVKFSQRKNKNAYLLRCGTKEARKFLDIVRVYVEQVPSMAHKLHIKTPTAGE